MSGSALKLCIPRPGQLWNPVQLAAVNPCLERMSAPERIDWALDYLPENQVLTSSFGAQSAVMLHLLSSKSPEIRGPENSENPGTVTYTPSPDSRLRT